MCKNKVQFQAGYSLIELLKTMEPKTSVAKPCLNGAGPVDFVALTAARVA